MASRILTSPGLEERIFNSSRCSAEGTLISTFSVPHREEGWRGRGGDGDRIKVASHEAVSSGRPRAEVDVLVGPHTALVIGPIEFCPSDLRRAEGDWLDEQTNGVILSMTSRQYYNENVSIIIFLIPYFKP